MSLRKLAVLFSVLLPAPVLTSAVLTSAVLTSPALAETVRVALLPVVVHTSDPDSTYVSEGLGDMLAARIERSGEVNVLRVSDRATTNAPEAILAAKKAGAAYVLYGSFTQFGAGASLDIRCAPVSESDPSGERASARHIFIQTGTLQEIIPKLDDLSDKIIRYLVSGAERIAAESALAESADVPVGPEGAGPGQAPADSLVELRTRVEALERSVFQRTSELGEEEQPAVAEAR